eukprot:43606-Eustigmatos_ZCMA.PRE.1
MCRTIATTTGRLCQNSKRSATNASCKDRGVEPVSGTAHILPQLQEVPPIEGDVFDPQGRRLC